MASLRCWIVDLTEDSIVTRGYHFQGSFLILAHWRGGCVNLKVVDLQE